MPRASPAPDTQPLAVELARERLRQQALAKLLVAMNTDPREVSHNVGGQLFLTLSPRALESLAGDVRDEVSTEELIEPVEEDLSRACHIVLERDRQGDGLVLKINSENWYLIVKPGRPTWLVVAVHPRTVEFRASLTGLAWRVIGPNDDAKDAVPLPLWLLARAELRDRQLARKSRELNALEPSADEYEAANNLRRIREQLPDAAKDLRTAFRLMQWERERRPQPPRTVTIAPLPDSSLLNGRCSYLIQGGTEGLPQRSTRFALGMETTASRVYVAPDPDSPSRWLLHGPAALPRQLAIYKLTDFEYWRQAKIVTRIASARNIEIEDVALAATQIRLPTPATKASRPRRLPGEAPWEPRQEAALHLALAGYAACAIKGPPGTGKSTVIVGMIRRAIHEGQRVLLVAPTHVALDEVLGRIHDLREGNLEQTVIPARVAPSDERPNQVRPALEGYIAHRLGRNLAATALKQIGEQAATLTPADRLQEEVRRYEALITQLRGLAVCREADANAQHELINLRAAYATATTFLKQCRTALQNARATLEAARHQRALLADATRQFDDVEADFFATRHGLAIADQKFREQQAALDHVHRSVNLARQRLGEAKRALEKAHTLEAKRRPGGNVSRLIERIFSPHARAIKALEKAEVAHAAARHDFDRIRQAEPAASAALASSEHAVELARSAATVVERDLRERLAPAEAAITRALEDGREDWFSAMPDSLRRAVAMCAEKEQAEMQAALRAESGYAVAEKSAARANDLHIAGEHAAASAREKVLALEAQLRGMGIVVYANLPAQIAENNDQKAAVVRELERTTRLRQMLEKWQAFYEREEDAEQVTAWALTCVNLVAATTQGIAGSKEFGEHYFDLVICDESSRVTRGEILVPAERAGRIVLVGDEKQLPPYVEADDEQLIQALAVIQLSESRPDALPDMARRLCDAWNVDEPEFRPVRVDEVCERARTLLDGGELPAWPARITEAPDVDGRLRAWRRVADALTGSCFDHVLSVLPPERVVRLSVQRRMPAEIAALVSEPVYDGDYQSSEASPIRPLFTQAFRHPWIFLNTYSYWVARPEFNEDLQGTGFINAGEARAVLLALKQHIAAARRTGEPVSLMVITFYLGQARLIESLVHKDKDLRGERIAILPIDRCQGQEADAVVVSFVRTLPQPRKNAGRWLQDVRRLNVCLTRARRSLVLIGNLRTLTALRGDKDGERLLAHLARCIAEQPDHQIEQLQGL